MTPSELSGLEGRITESEAVAEVIRKYGTTHEDDWAGVYIDPTNDSNVVGLFVHHTEEHRVSILHLVSPQANVDFRTVRYTLSDLQALGAELKGQDAWFATLPAALTGYDIDVPTNTVRIRISSIDPSVEDKIQTHLNWPAGSLTVESDGIGLALIGTGSITVVVDDAAGNAIRGAQCIPVSDISRRDIALLRISIPNAQGVCTVPKLLPTGYWVRVQRDTPGPGFQVLGYVRASVSAGAATEVHMTVK